jgi:CheY-like chemotaxis protein
VNQVGVDILLVEDNDDDAELALLALKRNNLANSIKVVGDGAEALDFLFGTGAYVDRASQQVPRLILLDLKLPKIDGLEVLRRVKADPRTQRIPIVALTSSRAGPDVAASYALNVNSYIVKPVDFEKFTEAVRQLGLYWLLLNEPPPVT